MVIESTGFPYSKRIVDGTGHLVAMAEQYTSGLWAVHDKETGKKLCPEQHKTATVLDGSGYSAKLLTKPEHFCAMFVSKGG